MSSQAAGEAAIDVTPDVATSDAARASGAPAAASDDQRERVAAFRAAFGSEASFRAFYDRALPRVYGYVFHRCCGNRTLAEDLTQAAFAEAVRTRDRYDGRSEPITWLVGIARHKLLDHFRTQDRDERRRLHLTVRELTLDRDGGVWREADEREELMANLGRLTAMQRAVLILRYADGLPVREIALELGRSEASVESLLTRARDALRAAYGESTDG